MVEPELEPGVHDGLEAGLTKERRRRSRPEAMVLVQRHSVDQPESDEGIEERIYRGRRRRDHDDASRLEQTMACLGHRPLLLGGDVFEDGQHDDGPEGLLVVGQIGGEPPPKYPEPGAGLGRRAGVDAHALPDATGEGPKQGAVVAPDIKYPSSLGDMPTGPGDAPSLEPTVKGRHAGRILAGIRSSGGRAGLTLETAAGQ
jgi:hypothetical protein